MATQSYTIDIGDAQAPTGEVFSLILGRKFTVPSTEAAAAMVALQADTDKCREAFTRTPEWQRVRNLALVLADASRLLGELRPAAAAAEARVREALEAGAPDDQAEGTLAAARERLAQVTARSDAAAKMLADARQQADRAWALHWSQTRNALARGAAESLARAAAEAGPELYLVLERYCCQAALGLLLGDRLSPFASPRAPGPDWTPPAPPPPADPERERRLDELAGRTGAAPAAVG